MYRLATTRSEATGNRQLRFCDRTMIQRDLQKDPGLFNASVDENTIYTMQYACQLF